MVVLTSFPPPEEGIEYRQTGTEAHVGSSNLGPGTLYVAQSRLSWVGGNGQGFSLEYPAISIHAISRDLTSFPKECLYLMVDGELEEKNEDNQEDSEGEEEDGDFDAKPYTEIRFAPGDPTCLDSVYTAMCSCQALHPDSDASYSGEDEEEGGGEGDYFQDAEGESQLTAQGRATLRHLESVFVVRGEEPQVNNGQQNHEAMDEDEPGQFEDAD